MKHLFFCVIFLWSAPLGSQNQYLLRPSMGYYNNPWYNLNPSKYNSAKGGKYYSLGNIYKIKSIAFGLTVLSSRFRYFDSGRLTNDPTANLWPNGTNSEIYNFIADFSILYSSNLGKNITLYSGIGFGILNMTTIFTTKTEYDLDGRHIINWNYRDKESFDSLLFPLNLKVDYYFYKGIGCFFETGAYIEPDFPVLGLHAGFGLVKKFQ